MCRDGVRCVESRIGVSSQKPLTAVTYCPSGGSHRGAHRLSKRHMVQETAKATDRRGVGAAVALAKGSGESSEQCPARVAKCGVRNI